MQAIAPRSLVLAAALLATAPLRADPLPASCQWPGEGVDPLADRAALLAAYEQMPAPCLRALFTTCTQAADRDLLDFGSAAVCSFGYEALLRQDFGGNFRALMAWWKSQRPHPVQ